nr:MAG TPA: hypothetical protein [Caudoviricetes sp.]
MVLQRKTWYQLLVPLGTRYHFFDLSHALACEN